MGWSNNEKDKPNRVFVQRILKGDQIHMATWVRYLGPQQAVANSWRAEWNLPANHQRQVGKLKGIRSNGRFAMGFCELLTTSSADFGRGCSHWADSMASVLPQHLRRHVRRYPRPVRGSNSPSNFLSDALRSKDPSASKFLFFGGVKGKLLSHMRLESFNLRNGGHQEQCRLRIPEDTRQGFPFLVRRESDAFWLNIDPLVAEPPLGDKFKFGGSHKWNWSKSPPPP